MSTQNRIRKKREVWIGLAQVVINYNGQAAFVNFLTYVSSKEEYLWNIETEAEKKDLIIIEIEDIEPLKTRLKNYKVADYLIKLSDKVMKEKSSEFGTFHLFDK